MSVNKDFDVPSDYSLIYFPRKNRMQYIVDFPDVLNEVLFVSSLEHLQELARKNTILTTDKQTVVAIGEMLYQISAMEDVYSLLVMWWKMTSDIPKGGDTDFHPEEISAAWNGIGHWVH